MKFSKFEGKMRRFEDLDSITVPDHTYMVARLDGRSFHTYTDRIVAHKPYDTILSRAFTVAGKMVMKESGFNIIYGYTQSDEISLLMAYEENIYNRRIRKIDSILASCFTAYFNDYMASSDLATFDCRTICLPTQEDVVDYFAWRQADCYRNSLNSYCHYTIIDNLDLSKRKAHSMMLHKTKEEKIDFLKSHGINFQEDIPNWQKYGMGLYWVNEEGSSINKYTNQEESFIRRSISCDEDLLFGQEYREWILRRLV